jgi:hypothetical protein
MWIVNKVPGKGMKSLAFELSHEIECLLDFSLISLFNFQMISTY